MKVIRPERVSPDALARFEREVAFTSRLTHPNTIAIYDYGHAAAGTFYYAMEFVEGFSFEEAIALSGVMPAARVVKLLLQVCDALEEAHREGVVHRDIKPANLMICERGGIADFVKVLDFGLAKDFMGQGHNITASNAVVGTPLYLAPEAIEGRPVGPPADVYALGAVAYFLLTQRAPFEYEDLRELFAAHTSTPPPALDAHAPLPIPAALESLVLRCLSKNTALRPQSAGALAALLRDLPPLDPPWSSLHAEQWWRRYRSRLPRRGEAGVDPLRPMVLAPAAEA